MIAKVATAQDDITGDGTTSNVLIIGELLKQADLYISEVLEFYRIHIHVVLYFEWKVVFFPLVKWFNFRGQSQYLSRFFGIIINENNNELFFVKIMPFIEIICLFLK